MDSKPQKNLPDEQAHNIVEGTSVIKGISPNLYRHLRVSLLDCGPFATDREITVVFVDKRLNPWRNRIPQAESPFERAEKAIDFLHNRYNSVGENALVLLLHVLKERTNQDDNCYYRLTELAEELEHELKSLDSDNVEKIGQSIQTDTETGLHNALLFKWAENRQKPKVLYGHKELIARVDKLLDESKHVLLTGFGGTGKTALAATIADNRIENGNGPVLWLRVGNNDANTLFEAISVPFGAKEQIGRAQSDEKVNFIQALLVDAGIGLLVLDDLRKGRVLVQMRRAMPKNVPLLVTSRQNFANIDQRIKVPDLSDDDALELLADQAYNEELSREDYKTHPESHRLCQEMGNHALGLVIAGGWLRNRNRSPDDLLKRIDKRRLTPSTIPIPESFIEEGRETVKMVLDETYGELNETAQVVFKAFGSLFAPHVTSSLLGIVAGYEDELDVEDALDELMSWNFVTREGSILVDMHDMVQSYAETVLFGSEMPNYQPTIASVQRYVVGHAQDFDSLQLDQPNILGAAKAADDETCASIIRVLALDGYFDARGHTMDFLLLLDKVLKYFRVRKNEETLNSDQLEILHYLLAKRGTAYFHRGDYENAAKIYKESLQLTDEVSRTVLLSGVTGKALSFQGNYDEAEKYFEEGKKVAEEAKDDFLLSFILDQEALAAGEKEDHDTVRHIVAKQVVINERLLATNQDPSQKIPLLEALIFSLVNLGTAEIMLAVQQQPATDNAVVHKQIQSAQAIFKRAEQIAITIDNSFLQANVLHALAESYHFLDEREKAQDLFEEARTLYSSRGAVSREKLIVTFMHLHGYPVMSDAVAAEGK